MIIRLLLFIVVQLIAPVVLAQPSTEGLIRLYNNEKLSTEDRLSTVIGIIRENSSSDTALVMLLHGVAITDEEEINYYLDKLNTEDQIDRLILLVLLSAYPSNEYEKKLAEVHDLVYKSTQDKDLSDLHYVALIEYNIYQKLKSDKPWDLLYQESLSLAKEINNTTVHEFIVLRTNFFFSKPLSEDSYNSALAWFNWGRENISETENMLTNPLPTIALTGSVSRSPRVIPKDLVVDALKKFSDVNDSVGGLLSTRCHLTHCYANTLDVEDRIVEAISFINESDVEGCEELDDYLKDLQYRLEVTEAGVVKSSPSQSHPE